MLNASARLRIRLPGRRIVDHHTTGIDYKLFGPATNCGVYPKARHDYLICTNETDIFMLGTKIKSDLWRFNKLTLKWTHLADPVLSRKCIGISMCMWNNLLVLYAGTEHPHSQMNAVLLLDPYAREPLPRLLETGGELPPPQFGQSMAVRGDHLYIVCGRGVLYTEVTCDVFRLGLRSLKWERLSKLVVSTDGTSVERPEYMITHSTLMDEQNIYLLGGRSRLALTTFATVWVFSVEQRQWRRVKTLPDETLKPPRGPESRGNYSCVQHTNGNDVEAIIAGGYDAFKTVHGDIWTLNLRTMRWRLSGCLPKPRHFHAAATDPHGAMYIFGGLVPHKKLCNGCYDTDEMVRVWTKVPKLAQLCWARMNATNPRLVLHSTDQLLGTGVPMDFVMQ